MRAIHSFEAPPPVDGRKQLIELFPRNTGEFYSLGIIVAIAHHCLGNFVHPEKRTILGAYIHDYLGILERRGSHFVSFFPGMYEIEETIAYFRRDKNGPFH